MPELPEVEIIKQGLQKKIIGLRIKDVQILAPKSFIGDVKEILGGEIKDIWRRGKVLGIEIASYQTSAVSSQTSNQKSLTTDDRKPKTILFHLKMSGQLVLQGESVKGKGERFVGGHPTQDMLGQLPNKHTRVIFELSDNSKLYFNDQRMFGWVKLVDSEQVTGDSFLGKMGPEPLEEGFSWQILKERLLKHKSQPVKVALMDQSVIAGVGNIYASEACFNAKIDPRLRVGQLTDLQFHDLFNGAVSALRDGIRYGGSTKTHFVDSDGHKGYFLDYAHVYNRDGHPCHVCQSKIEKITLAGRGTYLCPSCQRGL